MYTKNGKSLSLNFRKKKLTVLVQSNVQMYDKFEKLEIKDEVKYITLATNVLSL